MQSINENDFECLASTGVNTPLMAKMTVDSEVTGEDWAHDSAWKSVSDRQHVPIRQSWSDVHEARHFASWSSRLRDFSARACAI